MKLSLKHIAVFGQVRVNINPLDASVIKYISLLELYKNGWWVTDRTGTIITLVKPRCHLKDGFCCVCRRISTNINLDTLDLLTKPLAEEKYEQYKYLLQSKKNREKIKKSKEQHNENHMSALPTGNRDKYKQHVLFQTQGKNTTEIQRKL